MRSTVQQRDDADTALTRARREFKYLIPHSRLADLSNSIARQLPVHAVSAWGDSSPPLSDQAITTVYFDTSEHDLFRAADGTDRNVKLRVRAYDAVHPQMHAIADREGPGYDDLVWIELKRRDGEHTSKRRAAVPKSDLVAFLEHGTRSAEMDVIAREVAGTDDVFAELHAFTRDFGKALQPACVVHYVRCAWQALDGSVRVTVDRDVTFYPPTSDPWRRQDLTERSSLGRPAGAESSCVIEVKTRGEFPAWLTTALQACDANRVDYSKFVSAMHAMHDR